MHKDKEISMVCGRQYEDQSVYSDGCSVKSAEVPTVIVECGFLSNHKEAEKLSDEA